MSGQTNGQTMTDGFHLVLDALKLNGVENLYGVAGIPITDLLRLAQAEGFRYIGFRHEQSAANAAAIAGFITGKPGVCMTVSAPGFLNGLVGLANATVNCFPMVLISGSSDRNIVDLEQGDYEEMDQLSAARPYAKAAYRVNRPQDIGLGVARAIRAACSGRPGGVYLDLTAEVLGSVLDIDAARKSLIKVVDPSPAQPPAAGVGHARARSARVGAASAGAARQRRGVRARRRRDPLVHRDDRDPVPPDVDGERAASRQPSAVGGRRALVRDREGRRRARRRARGSTGCSRTAKGRCGPTRRSSSKSTSRRPRSTATARSQRRSSPTSSRRSRRSTPR